MTSGPTSELGVSESGMNGSLDGVVPVADPPDTLDDPLTTSTSDTPRCTWSVVGESSGESAVTARSAIRSSSSMRMGGEDEEEEDSASEDREGRDDSAIAEDEVEEGERAVATEKGEEGHAEGATSEAAAAVEEDAAKGCAPWCGQSKVWVPSPLPSLLLLLLLLL
jgi:hypothetical protein